MRLERWVNGAVLSILGCTWLAWSPSTPKADFDLDAETSSRLASLEEQVALQPQNVIAAKELAEAYLEMDRPGLVIAMLRAADASVTEHPMVGHSLARAYEASDRLPDALATAELTRDRCARAIGLGDGPRGTPVPRFVCTAREYALLSVHTNALARMHGWGVQRPSRDARRRLAYDLATRRARVAFIH